METYEKVALLSVNVSDVSIFSFKAIFVGLAIKFEMTSKGFLLLVDYQSLSRFIVTFNFHPN